MTEAVLTHDIVLYGDSTDVCKAYQEFYGSLRITAICTDVHIPKLPIAAITEGELLNKKDPKRFILLCEYSRIDEARMDQLFLHRLEYQRDYIDCYALRCLFPWRSCYGSRKSLIAYGNCHVYDTLKAMLRNKSFSQQFNALYYPLSIYHAAQEERFNREASLCHVFLYTIERFSTRYRDGESFIATYNPTCQSLRIPCYEFRGYFPQTDKDVHRRSEYDILRDMYSPFQRADLWIHEMLRKGYSDEEILQSVHGNPAPAQEIGAFYNRCIAKLRVMDRISDAPIAGFVQAEGKRTRLFKDPSHFSDTLICFMANSLLKKLGIEGDLSPTDESIHPFTEIPIYPCVAQALDLSFWTTDNRYCLRLTDGTQHLTLDDFIMHYLAYCRAVQSVMSVITVKKEQNQ